MTSTTAYALQQCALEVGTSAAPTGTIRVTVVTVMLAARRWDVAPRLGRVAESCRGRAKNHRPDEDTEVDGKSPSTEPNPWRSE